MTSKVSPSFQLEVQRAVVACTSALLSFACSGTVDTPHDDSMAPGSTALGPGGVVVGPGSLEPGVPGAVPSEGGVVAPGDTLGTAPTPSSAVPPVGTDPAVVDGPVVPVDGPVTPPVEGAAGASGMPTLPAFEPGPAMLRRLTRTQFRNAMRDVFDVEIDTSQLHEDSWVGNFATIGANAVVTTERGVEQYHTAIETAVDAVFAEVARRDAFLGCSPSGQLGDVCLRGYLADLGRRAWRRPLESVEIDQLESVAITATTELESPTEGARWATVAMFSSPNFLYRPELGAPATDGAYRYTGYEMASRLAFLIWNSLPDDLLLDAAASGALDTADGVRTAALRLLDAPAGRDAVGAFAEEFMRLDRVLSQAKDPALFPEYGLSLREAMVRDMREVWEIIAFDEQASILNVFSTPKVFVNSDLASLYGLDPSGLDPNIFEELELPASDPRVGILGKAAFLSQFANQQEGSPTLRGKFMRDALMCTTVPPPPGDVDIVLEDPPADAPMTKRDRLALHRENAACALCHSLMDPLGLPFESFDAIGRFRTTEPNGLTIDTSGEFDGQAVTDARALALAMGASESVIQCITRRYYTYAVGHEERDVDEIVVNELKGDFESAGYNFRELVLDVTTHEAFSAVAPQL